MNAGDMDRLHDELIAYIEEELSPEKRAHVESEIENSPGVRAEYEWLKSAYGDIEAHEREVRPGAGEIDIVYDVMQAVTKAAPTGPVISLDAALKKKRVLWPLIAAAAAIILAIAYIGFSGLDNKESSPPIAKTDDANGQGRDATDSANRTPTLANNDMSPSTAPGGDEHAPDVNPDTIESTQGPRIQLADVLDVRRDIADATADATTKRASIDKLLDWSRLDRQKASELINSGASPDVVVAASESLDSAERRRVLLTAVGSLQDDPNSRMQLARALDDAPSPEPAVAAEEQAQALARLSEVKSLDPDNALPYYFEAKVHLDEGDTQAALDAIAAAYTLPEASAYSLQSALAQSKALEAAGMEPDVARMVAALTAGVDENNFLCQLAGDLLKYAQGFLSANDSATAETIYSGVEQFGRQVEAGAELTQEQLAGVDIQRAALAGLGELYTTVESADGVASVTEATNALTLDVQELASFLFALDELFLKPMTTDFWNLLSGIILGSGDIHLFDNPEITSSASPAATP